MRIIYLAGAVTAAAITAYFGVSYYGQKQLNLQLNLGLEETIKEKDQLQASVDQLSSQLKEKEAQLLSLSDVQAIKVALTAAQANVENLSKDLGRINQERISLAGNNTNLSARLENTTKEYMRTIAELKSAQDQVARLNREQGPDKRKFEELNKKISDKTQELNRQKEELANLQSGSQALMASNKNLEKKLKELETARADLLGKVEKMQGEVVIRETPARQLVTTIASLREQLSQKEEQIVQLEERLNLRVATAERPGSASEKIDPKQQKTIAEMKALNNSLKEQIAALNDQLNGERDKVQRLAGAQRTGDGRKLEEVKSEMERLSGILIKKEFEIETAKKDALAAKEELVSMQARLTNAQDTLYTSRVNQEKLKELENQRITMQAQLTQVQQELLKKNELVESLQKNVDYLTMQVEKKEQEKASLDAKLSLLDSSTREEMDKQKKRGEETSQMYNSLKAQISQFSDAIALKEAEIENKRKEISGLREESASLRSRSAQLENDLLEAKESQKKLMGDLSAAVRLNSVLQERIRFAPGGQDSINFTSSPEDKRKADELKRRIEVILEPEKQ